MNDDAERQRLWDLYEAKPEGYPLERFFKAPTHPEYGLLRFDSWRIELWNVKELFAQAVEIGTAWLLLTVAFEFGRLVARQSWSELTHDYNLAEGRTWPLVLAWIALGPAVVRRSRAGAW